jgi:HSP20 family molecular chaperone IbpA
MEVQMSKVRDKALEAVAKTGLDDVAAELAGKLKEPELLTKAQVAAQLKGRELAAVTREKLRDVDLDDRAHDLLDRLSGPAHSASESAHRAADTAKERLAEWLVDSGTAAKLGMAPKRRTWSWWLVALVGVGVGYLIGTLTAGRRGEDVRDDLAASAERLAEQARQQAAEAASRAGDVAQQATGAVQERAQDVADDLAGTIRARLNADVPGASISELSINVAEGTVFVRGSLPEGIDESTLRETITKVPGVKDVDLQVTAGA